MHWGEMVPHLQLEGTLVYLARAEPSDSHFRPSAAVGVVVVIVPVLVMVRGDPHKLTPDSRVRPSR